MRVNRSLRIPVLVFVSLAAAWLGSRDLSRRAQAASSTPVLQSTGVPGLPGVKVVVYRLGAIRLGVERARGPSQRIVWSRKLTSVPERLWSPGPVGLVELLERSTSGQGVKLFAYVIVADSVRSAIAGRPSGSISGDRGVRVHAHGFTVLSADREHVGSVNYRFQTSYGWSGSQYTRIRRIHVPDYPAAAYPLPNATARTQSGDTVLLRVEIASTEQQRNTGLMNRTQLDPDSGMVFVWPAPVHESFWMENTYIPLSVAFLGTDGTVQEIQDMEALTTSYHTPQRDYQYAVETNLGFFKTMGIKPGDRLALHLQG